MKRAFRRFAASTSEAAGSPWMFLLAVLAIVVWGASGPIFQFSDTWQLVINTGTTIITFLMVFLVQNTQNRDAKAIHLKLDELIYASRNARTGLVNLEILSDEELEQLKRQFEQLQRQYPAADIIKEEVHQEVEATVHDELQRHGLPETNGR
ncbi:MAG: low affinity iron permease family protein [Chloroflexi bacterium]|nr:low affinity iron permease family protein [Chloroflexota bacterium]